MMRRLLLPGILLLTLNGAPDAAVAEESKASPGCVAPDPQNPTRGPAPVTVSPVSQKEALEADSGTDEAPAGRSPRPRVFDIPRHVIDWMGGAAIAVALSLLGLAGAGLMVLLTAVFPERTRRVGESLSEAPGASFVLGVLDILAGGGVTWVIAQTRPAVLIVVLPLFAVVLLLGLAGTVEVLGRRVLAHPEKIRTATSCSAAGWLTAYFAALVPILGWWLIAPVLLIFACGSFTRSLVRRAPPAAAGAGTIPPGAI